MTVGEVVERLLKLPQDCEAQGSFAYSHQSAGISIESDFEIEKIMHIGEFVYICNHN